MYYPRIIVPRLEQELKTREVIVLTGMRQVGKSTILRHLFDKVTVDNKAILDAENPLHRTVFEEHNYDSVMRNLQVFGIKDSKNAYVFIDELQFMPEATRVIKYLYDHFGVKFVVTGSSSYYLKNLFPESLSGRKLTFELYPLNFSEFLTFKNIDRVDQDKSFVDMDERKSKVSFEKYNTYFKEYMDYGGFPAVVLEPSIDRKKELLGGVFKSYFEIDVRYLSDFQQLSKVRDLILLISARVGSKMDISNLSSELGVSRETVYSYLSFLEQTYFISLLPRFSRSIDISSAGSKKLYFCDTGLANMLGRLSEGQLLGNSTFQALRSFKKIQYFTKKSGAEIDFIVDEKYALEVKRTPSSRDIFTVQRLAQELKLQAGYVISQTYSELDGVIFAQDL